ncbi:MAG: T9SS type A sorting domain-containing protein [Bacteroidia bacterium]
MMFGSAQLKAQYDYGDTIPCQTPIGTFPYMEDFENGNSGWFARPLSATLARCGQTINTPNSWQVATPAKPAMGPQTALTRAHSGDSAWVTGGASGSYLGREKSCVQSPCFNFTNLTNPSFSAWIWWQSQYDPSQPPTLYVDGANLQYSIDNGQTWEILNGQNGSFTLRWYNAPDISAKPGFLCNSPTPPQVPGWAGWGAGGAGNWVRIQHQLRFLAGEPNVMFRFNFAADFLTSGHGFAFDDVSICETPDVNFITHDTTLCAGQSVFLDAGCDPNTGGNLANHTYLWESGPSPLQGDSCRWEIFTANTVIVKVTNQCEMIDRDTAIVRFSPSQAPGWPDPQIFCPDDSFRLCSGNNNPNIFHTWSRYNPIQMRWDTISVSNCIRDDQVGRYAVVITDIWDCRIEDTTTMLRDTVPTVVLPTDDTVCIGTPFTLLMPTHVPGTDYTWYQDGVVFANTQSISPTAAAEYVGVLTTPFGCFSLDTFRLGVSLPPLTRFGPDRVECGPFCLTAIPGLGTGFTVLWNDGDTSTVRCFNPPFTGSVQVTNPYGCTATDDIVITAGNPYTFDLGPDLLLCGGRTVTLDAGDAGPGARYQWNTRLADSLRTLAVNKPGVYICTVSNADGCTTRDTIEVRTSPLTLNLGADRELCGRPGDKVIINGLTPGAIGYQWSGAGSGSNPSISATGPGTYILTVTDGVGCTATDQVVVTRRAVPYNGSFTASDPVNQSPFAYLGDPLTFTATAPSGTTSILWRFGDGKTGSGSPTTHTYQVLDTFAVRLIISDGQCSDTIYNNAGTRLNFVGIDENLGVETRIIPNPNDGRFTVRLNWTKLADAQLSIRDLQGRILDRRNLDAARSHQATFQLKDQAKGMYFLHIRQRMARQ